MHSIKDNLEIKDNFYSYKKIRWLTSQFKKDISFFVWRALSKQTIRLMILTNFSFCFDSYNYIITQSQHYGHIIITTLCLMPILSIFQLETNASARPQVSCGKPKITYINKKQCAVATRW